MTTFSRDKCYVWIWLPDKPEPVVAGRLEKNGEHHDFYYGQSYLALRDPLALSHSELPLISGKRFTSSHGIHLVLRDSLPDAWGQRILFHCYQSTSLPTIEQLLLSSSDRIGALHFQDDPNTFIPRYENHVSLEQLLEATQLIERGLDLPEELDVALMHGTSVGGARPKALIGDDNKKYIAKFSSSTDIFPMVQSEFAAMWLAEKVGLNVAKVKLEKVAGRYVLLVERFDREYKKNIWHRKFMVSALTQLGLDEMEGRYASYLDLADCIRKDCKDPVATLHELFKRIIFNILIGNTDDHAKNHAFFWDGHQFALTPAYDISPYLRAGYQATQAMTIGKQGAYSTLANAISAAPYFELPQQQAQKEADRLVDAIKTHWPEASEQARLTKVQCKQLYGTAILNPYCFYEEP